MKAVHYRLFRDKAFATWRDLTTGLEVAYYMLAELTELKQIGEGMRFRHVEAGPLVHSPYHAERHVPKADSVLGQGNAKW